MRGCLIGWVFAGVHHCIIVKTGLSISICCIPSAAFIESPQRRRQALSWPPGWSRNDVPIERRHPQHCQASPRDLWPRHSNRFKAFFCRVFAKVLTQALRHSGGFFGQCSDAAGSRSETLGFRRPHVGNNGQFFCLHFAVRTKIFPSKDSSSAWSRSAAPERRRVDADVRRQWSGEP